MTTNHIDHCLTFLYRLSKFDPIACLCPQLLYTSRIELDALFHNLLVQFFAHGILAIQASSKVLLDFFFPLLRCLYITPMTLKRQQHVAHALVRYKRALDMQEEVFEPKVLWQGNKCYCPNMKTNMMLQL